MKGCFYSAVDVATLNHLHLIVRQKNYRNNGYEDQDYKTSKHIQHIGSASRLSRQDGADDDGEN